MNRLLVNFTKIMVLVLVSVGYAFTQCSDSDKKALEALDKAWGDMTTRAELEGIYASDYEGIGLLTTTSRAATIDGNVAASAESPQPPTPVYDTYVITCTKVSATITHRVASDTEDGGRSYFRAIHVAEKQGGKWKIVSSTGHPMDDVGNIIYAEIDGYKAYLAKDVKWMEKHTAENYIGVNFLGSVMSKSQSIENMKNDKNTYDNVHLSDVRVRVDGDVGVITGVYNISGKDASGQPLSMKMRFSRTLKRHNGDWIAVSSQGTRLEDNVAAN